MPVYPLKASTSKRYLVDQNGVPFLLVGDSPWSILAQCTNAQIDTYLADRTLRGFNAIIVNVLEHKFADNAPSNIDGVAPFSGTAFQSTPNSTYFNRLDHLISQAANYGMCCILDALYLGFGFGNEGWSTEVAATSTANMQSWATFLAGRYASSPNIIWIVGGDVNPSGNATVQARTNDFATQLATSDTNHLITAHNGRGTMAYSEWTSASWLTLNNTYSTQLSTPGDAISAYAVSGPMPFFQIENYYEHEHSTTNQQQRSQFYWTVLGGGSGGMFGNDPIWYMSSTTGTSFADVGTDTDWTHNLNTGGAIGRTLAQDFLRRHAWHNLVPDSSHAVVTAGYGTLGSSNYVGAARSADGTLAMAYLPQNTTLTVDMSDFLHPVAASWFDPTNGTYTLISSSLVNSGTQTFTPSATNGAGDTDWVLLLEVPQPPLAHFSGT